MDNQRIERLAANPHYRMTAKQVSELRRARAKAVRHNPSFKRHDTDVSKHPTSPPKEQEATDDRAD